MERGDIIVAEARRWIGTPYLHQASVRGAGTDCLGLLRGVWRMVLGAEPELMPAYTQDWAEASGREVLRAAANKWLDAKEMQHHAAGDVLLFRMREGAIAKHVGIAAWMDDVPSFVHAYTGHGVIESALSDPWTRKIVGRYRFPERAN